ncbi:MAG: tyrosine-type recombinase/integrase [Phycisphaerales bacterium]
MASVSSDKDGGRRILWVDGDGKRHSVRLGAISKRDADAVRIKVEALLSAKLTGSTPPREVVMWVAELGDRMHAKLANHELFEPREKSEVWTIGPAFERFLAAQTDSKPATITKLKQTRDQLLAHFGEVELGAIDKAKAEGWRVEMRQNYATATVGRSLRVARQFWGWCVNAGMVSENPWLAVKAGSERNPERIHFVPRDVFTKVLDACPTLQWRLFLSLLRFGGMRCGEALALRWSDVNFARRRLWVTSSKTAHHAGGHGRWCPLFPELEALLAQAFAEAEDGADRVLTEFRPAYNPHTHTRRLIKRAGVSEWPKVLHNLRASRQIELCEDHPLHVVCSWLGNSDTVALRHYLRVRDADFDKATGRTADAAPAPTGAESGARVAQIPAQSTAAANRPVSPRHSQRRADAGLRDAESNAVVCCPGDLMGVTGLEPVTSAV